MTPSWRHWMQNPKVMPILSANEGVGAIPAPGAFSIHAFSIQTVAVIGAGEQGREFALRCAQAGFRTILEDVMPAKLRRAREEFAEVATPAPEQDALLSFALTVEDAVRDADVAIDFVPDELESKLEIFSLIDRMAPPKTVLCTPTRVLSISDLASCTYRADRCVALRAAGDLLDGPLLLVPGVKVGEAVLIAVETWLSTLGLDVSAGQDLVAS